MGIERRDLKAAPLSPAEAYKLAHPELAPQAGKPNAGDAVIELTDEDVINPDAKGGYAANAPRGIPEKPTGPLSAGK